MKTEKLRESLETVAFYADYNGSDDEQRIHDAAQQELSELQRLVDVVKGFIEDPMPESNYWVYLEKFRNIVGYKE